MNTIAMKISVVIPAYNAEKWVGRAIESVLKQTRQADEILVVDDGSVDGTAEVARSFGDKVRLIQQENAGVSVARNAGINAAVGDWIAFLDSDDEWFYTYLQKQVELLGRNLDLVWSGANFLLCYCNEDKRKEKLLCEKGIEHLNGKDYFDDYFQAFIVGSTGWSGTTIVRKQILIEAGLFLPGQPMAEDVDLWWRIAYLYPKIGYIPEPLAVYHANVIGSAMKTFKDPQHVSELIARHLQLAEQYNSLDRFRPCAQHVLRYWIHKYLHDERIISVRKMMLRFESLLPRGYVTLLKVLTIWPKGTSFCLPLLTKINKLLRLRI